MWMNRRVRISFLNILMPWLMKIKNGKISGNSEVIGRGLYDDLVMIFHQGWAVVVAR